MKQSKDTGIPLHAASAIAYHPAASVRPVTDAGILRQQGDFNEALRQIKPVCAPSGAEIRQIRKVLQDNTARPLGLKQATAERLASRSMELRDLVAGRHATGKAAEVVAAGEYRNMHATGATGMVNPPKQIAANIVDVVVSPDAGSKRDILFKVQYANGCTETVPGGQVKTGSARYVADSLVEMARRPGYGRTAYVDARFVNADGSPRVAADGFTPGQAERLKAAGVRLRGIVDLEQRSKELAANIRQHQTDGLTPQERYQQAQLRAKITSSYTARNTAYRAIGGAAAASIVATVAYLSVQLVRKEKVDWQAAGKVAGQAGGIGAAATVADAGLYHAATRLGGKTPEAAQALAGQWVAGGFAALATAHDIAHEARLVREGHITETDALAGTAFKTALNALPLVLGPLGLAAVPVTVAAQIVGRKAIDHVRAREDVLQQSIAEDYARVDVMREGMAEVHRTADENDRIFAELMGAGAMA